MRLKLRLRFILIISTVFLVIFASTATVLLRNAFKDRANELNVTSKAFAQLSVRPIGDTYQVYQQDGSRRVAAEIKKLTELNDNIANVRIVDISGNALFSMTEDPKAAPVSFNAAQSFESTYIQNSSGVYTTIIQPYIDTHGQHQLAIAYDISTENLLSLLKKQVVSIIAASLIGLTIAAATVYWLVNRFFLRPLELVVRGSAAIGSGDYSTQIDTNSHDEIGDLATSVNHMANSLKDDIYKLRQDDRLKSEFIMIASHNLRTPITVFGGNLSLLEREALTDKQIDMIRSMKKGLQKLSSFNEDMLTIASIESGKATISLEQTTLGQLLGNTKEVYLIASQQKAIELTWNQQSDDASPLVVSPNHIRGVMRNLLDNAVKFTPEHGQIRVEVTADATGFTFSVSDTGIGIEPQEMDSLFLKFHRATSTLEYDYEGTGIGLYACKLIVNAHHGAITANSIYGKGSTFTVRLPIDSTQKKPTP